MPNDKLRIGIIGHGFMGKMHAHAYRSLPFYYDPAPASIELMGVATQSEASMKQAIDHWGYSFGTTDYKELCAHPEIDVINCCTPNYLHKDNLLCALKNGKHVYMDKPLCMNLDEARVMADCARRHPNQITQMTFQYRFVPAMLRAKQLIERGALGRLFSARVCYLHAGYVDPMRPHSWRLDVSKSGKGGALFDLSAHVIDLTQHLLGDFDEVQHRGETFIKERPLPGEPDKMKPVEVDDVSLMMFRLKNGAVGTLETSRLATGVQDEIRFEAHGDKGAIRFNLMQPNYLEYYDATAPGGDYGGERGYKAIECVARYPKPASLPGPKNTIGWERFHIHCLYHFVKSIVEGAQPQPSILDGAKVQAVLEAALESGATKQWTKVPQVD